MRGCRSCNYWQKTEEKLERIDPATNGQPAIIGFCRRHAPQASIRNGSDGERYLASDWPRSASDDWCGEYDPNFD
jgi:hypothetical protein